MGSALLERNLATIPANNVAFFYFVQVRDKYCSAENISWSSAADEVKVELLTARYEEGGRKPCDDPLLVLLKTWPARKEFLENPRLIEGQVCF